MNLFYWQIILFAKKKNKNFFCFFWHTNYQHNKNKFLHKHKLGSKTKYNVLNVYTMYYTIKAYGI